MIKLIIIFFTTINLCYANNNISLPSTLAKAKKEPRPIFYLRYMSVVALNQDRRDLYFDKYFDKIKLMKMKASIRNGLFYNYKNQLINTEKYVRDGEDIIKIEEVRYVMDKYGVYYINEEAGDIKHSCFFAGGAISDAGWIQIRNGRLIRIISDSGHYKPNIVNSFQNMLNLINNGIFDFQYDTPYFPIFKKHILLCVNHILLLRYRANILVNQFHYKKLKLITSAV